jgi:hypothetical protein
MIFVNLLLTDHDIDCIAAYVREHLRDKANAASATAAVYAGMKGAVATGLSVASSSAAAAFDPNRGGPLPPFPVVSGTGVSSSGGISHSAAQYFDASDDSDGSGDEDDEDDDELLAAVAAVNVPRLTSSEERVGMGESSTSCAVSVVAGDTQVPCVVYSAGQQAQQHV